MNKCELCIIRIFCCLMAICQSLALAQGKNETTAAPVDELLQQYANAVESADKKLREAFDKQVELVRRLPKLKPDEKQIQIENLKTEQATFESHGTIPFSPTMRVDAINYLKALAQAEVPVAKAYDKRISQQITAKNDSAAAEMRLEKEKVLTPRVLGRWRMEWIGGNGIFHYNLYSDGTVKDGVGKIPTLWTLDKSNLNFFYKTPQGTVRDTCVLEPSGQVFSSTRDKYNFRCNGIRVDQ